MAKMQRVALCIALLVPGLAFGQVGSDESPPDDKETRYEASPIVIKTQGQTYSDTLAVSRSSRKWKAFLRNGERVSEPEFFQMVGNPAAADAARSYRHWSRVMWYSGIGLGVTGAVLMATSFQQEVREINTRLKQNPDIDLPQFYIGLAVGLTGAGVGFHGRQRLNVNWAPVGRAYRQVQGYNRSLSDSLGQ